MKKIQLKSFLVAIAIVSVLSACRKDKIVPNPIDPVHTVETAGVYVLSEGNFNNIPGVLTYYNYLDKVTTADKYLTANGVTAGIGTNDAKIYGSKMYIVADISGVVNVVDSKTAKLIKKIDFNINGAFREPRSIAFYKNNAFITLYDGNVAVIDTASLIVSKNIPVGRNPEQLVISNNKLYVANSGGLDSKNLDKTVSVIDLNTLTEIKKIEVAVNPTTIAADDNGNVYVIAYGSYPSTPKLSIIDNKIDAVKTTTDIDAGYGTPFLVNGDIAYYYTDLNKVKVYDVKKETVINQSFVQGMDLAIPYAIAADSKTGELFISDAVSYTGNSGLLYAFDKTGKMEYSFATGIFPGTIVLLNK